MSANEQPLGDAPASALARLRRFAPLAAVVLVMALVFAMGWHRNVSLETLVQHRSMIDAFMGTHSLATLAAFIGIYIVAVALSIPGATLLTICGGLLFGTLIGGLAAIVGATVGATLVFLIARSAVGEGLARRAGPLIANVAAGFCAHAFSYLLFLRLVPAFPFWLVNLAPALCGVRLRTFVAATVIGIIPGTFAFALFGAGLDSVLAAQEFAYKSCLAAGRTDCRLNFDWTSALTPELLAAFVALGLAVLIPVVAQRVKLRAIPPPKGA